MQLINEMMIQLKTYSRHSNIRTEMQNEEKTVCSVWWLIKKENKVQKVLEHFLGFKKVIFQMEGAFKEPSLMKEFSHQSQALQITYHQE